MKRFLFVLIGVLSFMLFTSCDSEHRFSNTYLKMNPKDMSKLMVSTDQNTGFWIEENGETAEVAISTSPTSLKLTVHSKTHRIDFFYLDAYDDSNGSVSVERIDDHTVFLTITNYIKKDIYEFSYSQDNYK